MDADEFRGLLAALGLSVRVAAERLGAAPASIQRWGKGERAVPASVAARLRALAGSEASAPQLVERVVDLERRVAALEAERSGPQQSPAPLA